MQSCVSHYYTDASILNLACRTIYYALVSNKRDIEYQGPARESKGVFFFFLKIGEIHDVFSPSLLGSWLRCQL
jgi:hypothetical protein